MTRIYDTPEARSKGGRSNRQSGRLVDGRWTLNVACLCGVDAVDTSFRVSVYYQNVLCVCTNLTLSVHCVHPA